MEREPNSYRWRQNSYHLHSLHPFSKLFQRSSALSAHALYSQPSHLNPAGSCIQCIMATLESIPGAGSLVKKLVLEEKRSHSYVSEVLKAVFPYVSRGLSWRSVRRYCERNNVHRTSRLQDCVVDRLVLTNIQKVCYIVSNLSKEIMPCETCMFTDNFSTLNHCSNLVNQHATMK